MCGIAGIFDPSLSSSADYLAAQSHKMGNSLFHRGPDGGDIWFSESAGIALAHRRLAIIDLSQTGHQPMTSGCGRFVISYNGEVYNHEDLKQELKDRGYQFKGHSDTEVIVAGFSHWGIKQTIGRLIGMFAIAVWDKKKQCLTLIRDRLGIKPLFWSKCGSAFLFGSELKAISAYDKFEKTIDKSALSSFFRHNYIPEHLSIFQDVKKLRPGHMLTISKDASLIEESFWTLSDHISNTRIDINPYEAVEELDKILGDAVQRRMISDVPLGAFLSGGIDSSCVAALMQKHSATPVKTFSIGFNEAGYNEAEHAKAVAKHLGCDHTELYVSSDEARDVIPKLSEFYDEPFSDSSQIPTYLVSKMTRDHVTVALSGDGGDELFCGYNRYLTAAQYAKGLFNVPKGLRNLAAIMAKSLTPLQWDRLFKVVPASYRPSQAGDKIFKLANLIQGSKDDFYLSLISHWKNPDQIVCSASEYKGLVWDRSLEKSIPDFVERMQYLDTLTYLPDDILTKVDRASMAVSLEARVPLLDHRVVEYAWKLPFNLKFRDNKSKWILRQVLYKYAPKDLIERPKMGFGVPIDEWLRGPLKDWAGDLLSPQRLKRHGLLNPGPIEEKWNEHLSGKANWQYLLWDVLMFESWYDCWMD